MKYTPVSESQLTLTQIVRARGATVTEAEEAELLDVALTPPPDKHVSLVQKLDSPPSPSPSLTVEAEEAPLGAINPVAEATGVYLGGFVTPGKRSREETKSVELLEAQVCKLRSVSLKW